MKIKINKQKLRVLYRKNTSQQIADILGCSKQTICRRLREFKIVINRKLKSRPYKRYFCISCHKQINRKTTSKCQNCENKSRLGNKNPRFKTGSSRLYYKRIARENLRQECFECKSKKNLCVHHVDRNRENNSILNLRMFCRSCHSKEHKLTNNFGSRTKIKNFRKEVDLLIKKYINLKLKISPEMVLDDLKNLRDLKGG